MDVITVSPRYVGVLFFNCTQVPFIASTATTLTTKILERVTLRETYFLFASSQR